MEELQALYSNVLKAVKAMYGEDKADELIKEKFITPYESLENVIDEFVVMSIRDKIGTMNSTEI